MSATQNLRQSCLLATTCTLLGCVISTSIFATPALIAPETTQSTTHRAPADGTPPAPRGTWNPQPITHNPWYAGANLGVGESADSNIGLSAGLNAGYRINSNVAAEINLLRLPYTNNKSNYLLAGNAAISIPVGQSLDAMGKIGLGIMKSPSKSNFNLLLGGGVNYLIPANALSFGAQLIGTVGTKDAQSFSILGNASYYFGG